MRSRVSAGTATAVAAALVWSVVSASPASATAPGLAITVPSSVSFGSYAAGARTISANLGTVTVSTSSLATHSAAWVATVSTTGFTTGGGTTTERIARAAVSYRSGAATVQSGVGVGVCPPGQPVIAVDLSVARTAFSCDTVSLLSATSVSWNPRLSISIGVSNVVGAYTGTITHSVA